MAFVWFIVVGLVAGWLAGQLVKGGGFGVVGDIVGGNDWRSDSHFCIASYQTRIGC